MRLRPGFPAVALLLALGPLAARTAGQTIETKLAGSNTDEYFQFGYSVSIFGDTVLVGALYEDAGKGAVYVFRREGTAWNERDRLIASDAQQADNFGRSVSIFGDTLLTGAPLDDDVSDRSGAAYVFVRSGTDWSEQAKLYASDASFRRSFGHAASLHEDTALVGSFDYSNLHEPGLAYVFERSGTAWNEAARLEASDSTPGDGFGNGVSVSGATAVVGAGANDHAGMDSGAAYVFVPSGTTWIETIRLTASDAAAGDVFGSSVSIDGATILVGATREGIAGSAYVFTGAGATWTEVAKLEPSDGAPDDCFGSSLSVSGDTIWIGARNENAVGDASGSVYVFERIAGVWTETAKLSASDGQLAEQLGASVASCQDVAVVGAPWDDDAGMFSGSAYVFERPIGASYCTSTINSTGAPAMIAATGCPSVAGGGITLRASPVPNTPSLFFYGPFQLQLPLANGFRCVGGPTTRSPFVVGAGNASVWSPDLSTPPHDQITAGSTWNFQTWFRDPMAGGSESNLSDGVSVTFLP